LSGEFENQIIKITGKKSSEIVEIINSAGKEFPCLSCPSNNECETFKWFIKWFGKERTKRK
jgi:hypothetical protein